LAAPHLRWRRRILNLVLWLLLPNGGLDGRLGWRVLQQLGYAPALMVQKVRYQQMKTPIQTGLLPIHFRGAREKSAAGLIVVKRFSLADIVGVSFAHPLRQPGETQRSDRLTGELVGDFMGDEIV
jgi:hypothetical protein